MKGAIFLDKDGTIHLNKGGYIYKNDDFEFVPGAIEGLKLLDTINMPKIIITNQGGIAREFYTEKQFHDFMKYINEQFIQNGVRPFSGYYFCPHLPDDNCNCRKPKPGMYLQAIRDFNLDITKSWAVGDNYRDIEWIINSGGRGVLVKKDGIIFDENAKDKVGFERADNILGAAQIILKASTQ